MKYKTGNITWTKIDMARVIDQALRNLDKPAPADCNRVKVLARRPYANLAAFMPKAHELIARNQMSKS